MIDMARDVNLAFAEERTSQLADARERQATFDRRVAEGKLIPLGGNQFRVNEPGTYDNGEVWTLNNGVALPQHMLDMTTGRAALYSAAPTWHAAGQVIPGGISDIDKVLELGGLAWNAVLVPADYTWKGRKRTAADTFHVVRDDTGDNLGVVGKIYTPVQNRSAFEFLQDLVVEFNVTWESAGALREGRRTFVSMRLPENVVVDAKGINDEVIPFLAMMNDHSGTRALKVVVTPWRPICGNTERFALRDAHTAWSVSHTTNALANLEATRKALGLSIKYFDKWEKEETALAQAELAMADFHKLIDTLEVGGKKIWAPPEPGDSSRAQTMYANRKAELDALARESRNFPGTAYGAERTLTEWLDHRGNKSDAVRATRIMEGADDNIKSAAHRQLLMLTNRPSRRSR